MHGKLSRQRRCVRNVHLQHGIERSQIVRRNEVHFAASTIACKKPRQAACRESSSVAAKRSSATSRPTISSFPTLQERPMPCCGKPRNWRSRANSSGGFQASGNRSRSSICTNAEAIRSPRPARIPEDCGPPIALPPLNATRLAPSARKCRRLSRDVGCAAASTSTEIACARATEGPPPATGAITAARDSISRRSAA
jgi:hypothetical protein